MLWKNGNIYSIINYGDVMSYRYNVKKSNYANRGMGLEEDINISNEYYKVNNIALIYKKPTPIRIAKVDYNHSKIVEAFFEKPSTLDYNGIYKGKYIEFDVKETQSKTSFALSNIHKHQLEHIKKVIEFGGISFLIIRFSSLDKNYVLFGQDLIAFIETSNRKSIPLSYFIEKAYEIEIKYIPRLDYIKIIEKFGGFYSET